MKIQKILGCVVALLLCCGAQAQSLPLANQKAALEAVGQGQATTPLLPTAPAIPKSTPAKVETQALRGLFSGLSVRPFGESVFRGDASRYVTPSDMPVPADYVIGVGDVVELRLFGKENRVLQLRVERNGFLTLPDIGPVAVMGMSFEAMSSLLLERISKQKIGVEATVSMGALRSIQIFLTGEIGQPGSYTVDGLTTAANALMMGGGVKATGSLRKIEVQRHGRVVAKLDLYDQLLKGKGRADLRLLSGDVIFVPQSGAQVAVSGDVVKPAIYELLHEKTAEDVIALSGGLLPSAYPNRIRLDRLLRSGSRETHLLATAEKRGLPVVDGDVIAVPSAVGLSSKGVMLTGAAANGSTVQWKEGMHIGQLIGSSQELAADYFRPVAVVERTEEKTGAKYFVAVNLYEVLNKGLVVPLQPEDKLIILRHEDVEFLSSMSVQNVLFGKLPHETAGANLKLAAEAVTSGTAKAAQTMEQPVVASAAGYCKGLAHLADVVGQEGAFRFRGAVAASSADVDGVKLTKNQTCTGIYDQFPGLLSFLLENVAVVRGEVVSPGLVAVAPGMTVEMAISARGGMTRSADDKSLELTLFNQEGGRTDRRRVTGVELGQVTLEPGATVNVRKKTSDQDTGLVKLGGEFSYPGVYAIRKGEKLSELIARAGGLTSLAYPFGAVFQRSSVKEEKKIYYAKAAQELQQSILFSMTRQRAASSPTDGTASASPFITTVMNELKSVVPTGRMVVEADPTVLQVRPDEDLVLQPGDEVYMPRRPSHVNVMGEVLNPGAVQFKSGKAALDYVKDAGGTTRLADADRVYIVLPNGASQPLKMSSWNYSPALVPPGSTIYVTREVLPTTGTDLLLIVTQVARDLALAAASLIVIGK